jgi:hypothetical protein
MASSGLARNPLNLARRLFRDAQFIASLSGALSVSLAIVGLMSYAPTFFRQGLTLSLLGSTALLSVWSGASMLAALAARALPQWIGARMRLVTGLLLAGCGELASETLAGERDGLN